MRVREIMTGDPCVVTPGEPVSKAATLMEENDIGWLPVVRDRDSMRLDGVITDRDITVRHVAHAHRDNCLVGDHMTRSGLVAIRPEDDVHDLVGRMRHDQVRRIPVLDDQHRLVGVVAQADLALSLGPSEPQVIEEMLAGISQPTHAVR